MICRTGSPSRVVVVGALLTCGAFSAFAARASAAEVTLDTLRSQLRETLSGLQTIEMHYRVTQKVRDLMTGKETQYVNDYEWIRDGVRTRYIRRPGDLAGEWSSFDGQQGFKVSWDSSNPSFPMQITKTSSRPANIGYDYLPSHWLGLTLPDSDRNLMQLLDDPQVEYVKVEQRDQVTVHEVNLGVHRKIDETPWLWRVWLCPDRDGLPVEIQAAPANDHPERERILELMGIQQFRVPEFREIADESLERKRWWPRQLTLNVATMTRDHDIHLSRVNHTVPAPTFQPEPQPGTRLVDATRPGREVSRVHEPQRAIAAVVQQVARDVQSQSESLSDGATVIARPRAWSVWSSLFRWAGAVLLLAAGLAYVIAARNGRS